jgi:PAS domain S-box-containing protein
MEGMPLHSLSHSTDSGAADDRLAAVLDGRQETDSWERVLAHGDGSPLPVVIHAALMRDADGAPDGVATFVQDLTALRRAESALARREAKFEAFALRAGEWVLVMDESGTLLHVSPAVSRLLGHDPVAITGRNGWDFVHPDELADARRSFDSVVTRPGSSQTVELRVIDAAGHWHWAEQVFTNRLDLGCRALRSHAGCQSKACRDPGFVPRDDLRATGSILVRYT